METIGGGATRTGSLAGMGNREDMGVGDEGKDYAWSPSICE